MTILSFQLANIGEAGQVPTFLYLNTNNTEAEVTTAGYLNHFVAQGNSIAESQMAMVVTRPFPTSRDSSVILCNITFSGSDWSLVKYGASAPATNVWKTDASNTGAGLAFGTSSANGWSWQTNGASHGSVASNGAWTLTKGLTITGHFNVTSLADSVYEAETISIHGTGPNTLPNTSNIRIYSTNNISVEGNNVALLAAGVGGIVGGTGAGITATTGNLDLAALTGTVTISASGGAGVLNLNCANGINVIQDLFVGQAAAATTVAWAAPAVIANPTDYDMVVRNKSNGKLEVVSLAP